MSKKKLKKNGKCNCGYNFSDEIRYTYGKYKSYKISTVRDDRDKR